MLYHEGWILEMHQSALVDELGLVNMRSNARKPTLIGDKDAVIIVGTKIKNKIMRTRWYE